MKTTPYSKHATATALLPRQHKQLERVHAVHMSCRCVRSRYIHGGPKLTRFHNTAAVQLVKPRACESGGAPLRSYCVFHISLLFYQSQLLYLVGSFEVKVNVKFNSGFLFLLSLTFPVYSLCVLYVYIAVDDVDQHTVPQRQL